MRSLPEWFERGLEARIPVNYQNGPGSGKGRNSKGEALSGLRRLQRYIGYAMLLSAAAGVYLLATDGSLWILAVSHAYGLVIIVVLDVLLGIMNLIGVEAGLPREPRRGLSGDSPSAGRHHDRSPVQHDHGLFRVLPLRPRRVRRPALAPGGHHRSRHPRTGPTSSSSPRGEGWRRSSTTPAGRSSRRSPASEC